MMKKQRKEEEEEEEEDRISQLPQPLLHRILCSGLSQEEAVRTCVLSKSWRHLGPTRPKIEFGEEFFNGNEEEICLSVLDKTLQRYHDQKLSIQEFIIDGMKESSKSFELLEKWVLLYAGANKFHLSLVSSNENKEPGNNFRLPPAVLAEFLTEIYLWNCQIDPLVVDDNVLRCKHLQKLRLGLVYISDATLDKIMSSCPLIEYLAMYSCKGLQTLKLTNAPNLKEFEFVNFPNFQSSITEWRPSWIQNPDMYFPRLKSLRLYGVRLSNESIDKFSTNLPCLEKLALSCFSDSEQFKLSSRSITHLTIAGEESLKAVFIDAPNILCFHFSCVVLPSSNSFTTTSIEWKSISTRARIDFDNDALSWFRRLSEICKTLSTSQISLHICGKIPQVVPDTRGYLYQPFVIENLSLDGDLFSSVPEFLNCFFHNFRPRNIQQTWSGANNLRENQLIELLRKILLSERERARYFEQQDLEDAKMEAFAVVDEEWRGVEGTSLSSFPEFALHSDKQKIRFRLKWKE